mgnify:CR=1 FL=1
MAGNKSLRAAHKAKEDEFYTELSDIENELKHYKEHFKDKVVLCNCDDPRISNFFHYFSYNFEQLGLKKLITTCYKIKSVTCSAKIIRSVPSGSNILVTTTAIECLILRR